MKLRCTPNSIRLRVRKSDLDVLQNQGEILASLNFGGGVQLRYALKTGPVKQPQAEYTDHQITITLPLESTKTWINSEQVSIEYHQAFAEGQSLHLLIEKDFPCRHTEEQDLKDTFFELAPKDETSC
ncbi:DUF7009 family protein [Haliscomenobacter hydrossis]|uniref:Uncharacterized protein n=1 Tax=Haliscomenobacter hydrossis (strain ATCC 27775 / DSM 1100 / LMG 10767 / O) TaxID=760192 RepID=F4KXG3_HALH1|nr:hypothetical protein [Haliscomenobacter hydrossis]AEE50334.1 hypothetical protein Halhy_2461 [Haliscomenobacter hydrossis DSM 1100]